MAGCGGGGGVNNGLAPVVENTTNAPALNSSPSVSLPVGEAEKEVSDFEFSVLPESFLSEEDHADLSMEVVEGSATVTLRINAENAEQLRALYFQVLYDANEFSPIGVDVASRFGQPEDMLTATFMQTRGLVQHGQVLIDPLNQDGFSGSATLAELRFMREPATLLRGTRTTPTTAGSAAVLIADEENHQLSWGYASVGDYDQNLETNVADLTPIATRLLKGGPFSYFDIDDVIDGDGNDEINIADITPIGVNFRNRVLAYNVYKTLDQNDYPAANDAPSTISRVGQVLYEEASGSRFTERLRFAFDVGTTDPDAYYWVRPTDNFLEGTPSNIAAYGAVGIPLPTADLQADVTTGEVPLTVNFDASASVAPSSSIVDYEWDLDGDGTFNEADNGEDLAQGSSTAQFTYNATGLVNVSVRVSNSFNLKSSASVGITPTEQANLAPTASISADVSSGELPLAVNFDASASFDTDGTIVLYEWDFDGDGTFDSNTGTSPSAGFVYSNAGTYDPVVRVTDDDGAVDTASLTESGGSTLDVNRAPVADIAADTLSGTLPLTVNFDASGSSDLDGSIVLYEWDFEGDGTFESSTGTTATTSFTYTAGGTFDPAVRVTDNKGATDTASISETVGGGITVNIAPSAAISADTLSGNLPLTINFDASASSDVDGTIVSYEWDFDGDGSWDLDTGTTATTSFEYTTSGSFDPAVRVTDDDGASDVASLSENGGGTITINAAPTAVITGSPLSGTLPLTVDFDASASSDSDGTIVKFEWDFDGDGSWDLDTGTTATTSFEYTTAGNFDPAVRVTDDDGATGIAHLSENGGGIIDLNDPPVADITGSPLSGTLPLTVSFDASASTDSDGTIVKYEWDFDGDGSWDLDTGSTATTSFEYTTAGVFDAVVRVTDDLGATDTESLSENGLGSGIDINDPPVADITASPLSGALPLTVNFDASGSTDSDGTIVTYEWDFDGDGSWDANTGSTGTTSFEYTTSGDFDPAVRVTDDDGATDIAHLSDNGGGTIGANDPPVADITASPLSGTLPLTVNFDASGSTDSDGTIVSYEWDFDGDGNWDLNTGTTATTSFEYTTAGVFDAVVRVTDDDGATDTESLSENGLGTGIDINDPPVAAISASPLSGALPLTVNFDASASTDSDGTIVSYEWDFDGDGIWDENSGTSPTTSFEYTVGGSFDAAVRVTDNDGATDVAHLSDGGGTGIDAQEPPLADITATPNSGPAPLVVSFDASGSSDPDGSITLYEWDLDFNGSFETSTGSTPNTGSTYIAPGVKTISVRVTDDDGLTDTASVNVDVTSGWSTGNVILNVSLDSKVSIASFDSGANARLGLAYKDASGNDLYFVRTTDNTGYNWGTPIAVQTTGQVGNDCTLADIGGFPGITFKRAQSKLDYIQATATDGSTWWANSIEIDGGGGAGAFTSLAFVDGKPAASGIKSGQDKLRFVGATTANGTSWGTPLDVDPAIGSEEMEFTDLAVINGNPGILFNYVGTNTGLKFVRSSNVGGSSWGSSVTVDAPTAGGRYPSLHTVSGNPAASYQAFALNQLRYSRASDANGAGWNTPVVIDSGTGNGQWTTLSVVDGVPVIAYYDGGNGDLKFATATDATGTSWNTAVLDSTGDVGKFANMTLLNGSPVIAYYDVTNSQLKIAIYVPAP
ncbi:MAG: PKD domain-containing protein [bacterium]